MFGQTLQIVHLQQGKVIMNTHRLDHVLRYPFGVLIAFFVITALPSVDFAQQTQIPTLQVCNHTLIKGAGTVRIASRADSTHSGSFKIEIGVVCRAKQGGIPSGNIRVTNISMTDSTIGPAFNSTLIEQVTSAGRSTPMAFINGRCDWHGTPCRFWMMLTDNASEKGGKTPDIVSFLVFNPTGGRIAYASGPVVEGNIRIESAN